MPTVVLAHFKTADDVGVVQNAGDARLSVEALHQPRTVGDVLEQDLERHRPLGAELAGLVDGAHGAGANFFQEQVVAQLRKSALARKSRRAERRRRGRARSVGVRIGTGTPGDGVRGAQDPDLVPGLRPGRSDGRALRRRRRAQRLIVHRNLCSAIRGNTRQQRAKAGAGASALGSPLASTRQTSLAVAKGRDVILVPNPSERGRLIARLKPQIANERVFASIAQRFAARGWGRFGAPRRAGCRPMLARGGTILLRYFRRFA